MLTTFSHPTTSSLPLYGVTDKLRKRIKRPVFVIRSVFSKSVFVKDEVVGSKNMSNNKFTKDIPGFSNDDGENKLIL